MVYISLVSGTLVVAVTRFVLLKFAVILPKSAGVVQFNSLSTSPNILIVNVLGLLGLFTSALAYVINSKSPILCDVKIDSNQKVVPKIDSGQPIHNMSPRLEKSEVEKIMKNEI